MGLLGSFVYENKEGEKFWLHKKEKGNKTFYYFSKDPQDAISSKPSGYTVKENPNSHMPYLKKGTGEGIAERILSIFGL